MMVGALAQHKMVRTEELLPLDVHAAYRYLRG
jgi:hypothetical protein